MQPGARLRTAANPGRHHGERRENAGDLDDLEARAFDERAVFGERTVARMLQLARGSNEPAAQQQVDARLQVRQVRHRDEQLSRRRQHAPQFRKGARLIRERQVLEHVETQHALEGPRLVRQRQQRPAAHERRAVVLVEAFDFQPAGVLLDEHAFAAAGIEHARARRQRVEITRHGLELRDVGRVVVPVGAGRAVVVATRGVFAGGDVAGRLGPLGHYLGCCGDCGCVGCGTGSTPGAAVVCWPADGSTGGAVG